MKRPLEAARRWLAQAEHDLQVTRIMFENGLWAKTCFESEQTAQLALKAFLYGLGRRAINIHSIGELILECGSHDEDFLVYLDRGKTLDKYYLPTRYPDALPPPAIPYQSFTEDEARQALDLAVDLVQLVRQKIPGEAGSA